MITENNVESGDCMMKVFLESYQVLKNLMYLHILNLNVIFFNTY